MLIRLIVVAGPDRGRVFDLPPGWHGQLGRGEQAELRLTDPAVSRVHAHLEHQPDGLHLINLSDRETRVNGVPAAGSVTLADDHRVAVGDTLLRVCVADADVSFTAPDGVAPLPLPLPPPGPAAVAVTRLSTPLPARWRPPAWVWGPAGGAAAVVLVGAVVLGLGGRGGEQSRGLDRDDPSAEAVAAGRGDAKLFVLAVGVSKYQNPDFNLSVADKDADRVAAVVPDKARPLFPAGVEVAKLTNADATRGRLLAAVKHIEQSAASADLVLVTLSGHGERDKDDFYFLTHDFDPSPARAPEETAVFWDELMRRLGRLPCRAVVLLDACHSGAATRGLTMRGDKPAAALSKGRLNQQLKKSLSQSGATRGILVVAACLGGQPAAENPAWGGGALSVALTEVVGGEYVVRPHGTAIPKPDAGRPAVTWKQAVKYLDDRVKEITRGGQEVVFNTTGDLNLSDMPLAGR